MKRDRIHTFKQTNKTLKKEYIMNNFLALSVLSTATFILSFPFLKAEAVPNNYQSFEQ